MQWYFHIPYNSTGEKKIQKVPLHGWKGTLPEVMNQNPSVRSGLCSCEFLGQGSLRPQNPQKAVTTAPDCMPEPDSEPLLLKTPHALTIRHGEIKVDLTENTHPASCLL